MVGNWNGLTAPLVYACPKPQPAFVVIPFFVFIELRREVIVRFVDIGEIVDYHCCFHNYYSLAPWFNPLIFLLVVLNFCIVLFVLFAFLRCLVSKVACDSGFSILDLPLRFILIFFNITTGINF